ncbi:hypothetical protein H9X96_17030 [Pedobacter sp. N36a]|uniref:DUF6266 family protein n=1 Tax=Pedobacter sp. N36a TaxID=2767996 RepID=UPI001656F613|nr:DUF6266 family protein [Pedobacter sp. N36a]MBC8987474.1 hypothetical protein [Pedobacter sp. N36a]
MAISKNGIHGWPSGKLGRVVYYMLRGQHVQRGIGKPGKPSLKQKANHESMAVVTRFLGRFKEYLNNGFELEARGTIRNQHNLAVSCNKKSALKGEYPNISIDYTKVQLSKGSLTNPENVRMKKVEGGLQISWDPLNALSQFEIGEQYDDCLQLAVYFPKRKSQIIELNFSKRGTGTAFLPLNEEEFESPMEVFLFLSAANHTSVSDTLYLGNMNGTWDHPKHQEKPGEDLGAYLRFEQIKEQYNVQMKLKPEDRLAKKAFNSLEKEYLVLMNRYESTSRSRQTKPV